MLFALLGVALAVVTIAVFHTITENASAQEKSDNSGAEVEGGAEIENQDKQREQEAQKKIAKANSPKKNMNKNPVQQISPIPIPKKQKNKDMGVGGISNISKARSLGTSKVSVSTKRR